MQLKRHLRANDQIIWGGQPPSGSDHFPVIEIKGQWGTMKGSQASYKPDLVCFKKGLITVIEIKPAFSKSDVDKLRDFISTPSRVRNFIDELAQRRVTHSPGLVANRELLEAYQIEVAIAYAGAQGQHPISEYRWVGSSFEETHAVDAKLSVRSAMI